MNLTKFFAVLKGEYLQQLQYKMFFVTFLMTSIFQLLITLIIWEAISSDNYTISYMFVATLLTFMYKTDLISFLSYYVKSGDLAILLSKPFTLHSRLYALFLSNVTIQLVLIVIPIAIVTYLLNPSIITEFNLPLFIISLTLAINVFFLYSSLVSMFVIKLKNSWGLINFDNLLKNFFAGAIIPIFYFPENFQLLFKFLPFNSFINYPILIAFGDANMQSMFIQQVIWILILFIINKIAFKFYFEKNIEILGA